MDERKLKGSESLVVKFGLALNLFVISIIIYAAL